MTDRQMIAINWWINDRYIDYRDIHLCKIQRIKDHVVTNPNQYNATIIPLSQKTSQKKGQAIVRVKEPQILFLVTIFQI